MTKDNTDFNKLQAEKKKALRPAAEQLAKQIRQRRKLSRDDTF